MMNTANTAKVNDQGRENQGRPNWKAYAVLGLMLVATASASWARPPASVEPSSAGGKQPVSAERLQKPGHISIGNRKPGAIGLAKPGARRATIGLRNGFNKPGSKRNVIRLRKPGSVSYKPRALAHMCEEFQSGFTMVLLGGVGICE